MEDEIARELTILQRVTWAPAFSSAGKKHLRDVYFLSTRNLTYPSKGRKLKQVPGYLLFKKTN